MKRSHLLFSTFSFSAIALAFTVVSAASADTTVGTTQDEPAAEELGGKDGGKVIELGGKDGGKVIELGGKDGGKAIELGGKDGGKAIELGGKDGGKAVEL